VKAQSSTAGEHRPIGSIQVNPKQNEELAPRNVLKTGLLIFGKAGPYIRARDQRAGACLFGGFIFLDLPCLLLTG
jgi:hypothetical protein